MLKIKKIYSQ